MVKDNLYNFVPIEMALILKELNYDMPSMFYYFPNFNFPIEKKYDIYYGKECIGRDLLTIERQVQNGNYSNTVKAPLWQEVIDWLRIKHKLHIYSKKGKVDGDYYYFMLESEGVSIIDVYNDEYDKSRLFVINKALEYLLQI